MITPEVTPEHQKVQTETEQSTYRALLSISFFIAKGFAQRFTCEISPEGKLLATFVAGDISNPETELDAMAFPGNTHIECLCKAGAEAHRQLMLQHQSHNDQAGYIAACTKLKALQKPLPRIITPGGN